MVHDFTVTKTFQDKVWAYLILIGPFVFGLLALRNFALRQGVLSLKQIDDVVLIGSLVLIYLSISLYFKLKLREGVIVQQDSLEVVSLLPVLVSFADLRQGDLCVRKTGSEGRGYLYFIGDRLRFSAPCSDCSRLTEVLNALGFQVAEFNRSVMLGKSTLNKSASSLFQLKIAKMPWTMKLFLFEVLAMCVIVSMIFAILFEGIALPPLW